jgi:D-beta-D-heptose 7-phosphate kinase/D-beta-D-heptose 1-phosphate adenosyltransferase
MEKVKKVWVNGSFDVLHIGHIDLFRYAKSLGEELIVSIDSDRRIKESKGNKRPVNNSSDRKEFLESICYVDKVLIFDSYLEMKKQIVDNKIDIIVVSDDCKEDQIVGSDLSDVVVYKKRKSKSTTSILKTYYKEAPPF